MAFGKAVKVTITPPNLTVHTFKIVGTEVLVQNKFPPRVLEGMAQKQAEGSTAQKKTKRDAKDFELCGKEATHYSSEGWAGLPASAFRAGLISTCRLLGFPMTKAKLCIFVVADGYETDKFGTTPLVKITKGKPTTKLFAVRNETGVADIRPRPEWAGGWEAQVKIRWDADHFTAKDILNLLARMGAQVGIGAGRHDSKDSAGQGWGTFDVVPDEE